MRPGRDHGWRGVPVPTSLSLDRIPFDVLAFCKLVKEKLNGA